MSCRRWPLHPHPFNEESLLSWLIRIANCYEFTLEDLLQYDLDFYGDPNDLNMHAPTSLLTLLSERTGIDPNSLYAQTLASWSPFLLDDSNIIPGNFELYVHHYSLLLPLNHRRAYRPKKPWKPWLITKLSKTLRACPICIASGPPHVINLMWYLPIMLSCPIHHCLLRQCDISHGDYVHWKNENDLILTSSPAIRAMDQKTWSALTTGEVILPRQKIHAAVWFRLLRTLLDELYIPVSSTSIIYAKNIMRLWNRHGLKPRCDQRCWHPYELLPSETQEQTLTVAATAFEMIEHETTSLPGEHIYLFLAETINSEDLVSYPAPYTLKTEMPKETPMEMLYKIVEEAKKDPDKAKDLRRCLLFGKVDFKSIRKIESIMIEAGIPPDFLAP